MKDMEEYIKAKKEIEEKKSNLFKKFSKFEEGIILNAKHKGSVGAIFCVSPAFTGGVDDLIEVKFSINEKDPVFINQDDIRKLRDYLSDLID